MSWTHRAGATMIKRFPQLGTVPSLLENWPSLRLAVEKKEQELGKTIAEAIKTGEIAIPDPTGKGIITKDK